MQLERIGQPELVGGPGSSYDGYFELKERTANPVYRQIYDAFRFADLSDERRRILVQRLAALGDQILTAPCNQYTISVMGLLKEREAIMATLDTQTLPATLAEWKQLEKPDSDLDITWSFSFDEAAKQIGDIMWSVPLAPRECYARLEDIVRDVKKWHRQRAESEAGGYFFDTWPLISHFALPPERRELEDYTRLLPFFYQEAFRYCATSSESLLGHIQAVNADGILQQFGGLSLRPEQLRSAGLLPELEPKRRQ